MNNISLQDIIGIIKQLNGNSGEASYFSKGSNKKVEKTLEEISDTLKQILDKDGTVSSSPSEIAGDKNEENDNFVSAQEQIADNSKKDLEIQTKMLDLQEQQLVELKKIRKAFSGLGTGPVSSKKQGGEDSGGISPWLAGLLALMGLDFPGLSRGPGKPGPGRPGPGTGRPGPGPVPSGTGPVPPSTGPAPMGNLPKDLPKPGSKGWYGKPGDITDVIPKPTPKLPGPVVEGTPKLPAPTGPGKPVPGVTDVPYKEVGKVTPSPASGPSLGMKALNVAGKVGNVFAVGAGGYTAYKGYTEAEKTKQESIESIDAKLKAGEISPEQADQLKKEAASTATEYKGGAIGEGTGMAAGAIGGGVAGAKVGGAIGGLFGGVGALPGMIVGGLAGSAIGAISGSSVGRNIGGVVGKGVAGVKSLFGAGDTSGKPEEASAQVPGAATKEAVAGVPTTREPEPKVAFRRARLQQEKVGGRFIEGYEGGYNLQGKKEDVEEAEAAWRKFNEADRAGDSAAADAAAKEFKTLADKINSPEYKAKMKEISDRQKGEKAPAKAPGVAAKEAVTGKDGGRDAEIAKLAKAEAGRYGRETPNTDDIELATAEYETKKAVGPSGTGQATTGIREQAPVTQKRGNSGFDKMPPASVVDESGKRRPATNDEVVAAKKSLRESTGVVSAPAPSTQGIEPKAKSDGTPKEKIAYAKEKIAAKDSGTSKYPGMTDDQIYKMAYDNAVNDGASPQEADKIGKNTVKYKDKPNVSVISAGQGRGDVVSTGTGFEGKSTEGPAAPKVEGTPEEKGFFGKLGDKVKGLFGSEPKASEQKVTIQRVEGKTAAGEDFSKTVVKKGRVTEKDPEIYEKAFDEAREKGKTVVESKKLAMDAVRKHRDKELGPEKTVTQKRGDSGFDKMPVSSVIDKSGKRHPATNDEVVAAKKSLRDGNGVVAEQQQAFPYDVETMSAQSQQMRDYEAKKSASSVTPQQKPSLGKRIAAGLTNFVGGLFGAKAAYASEGPDWSKGATIDKPGDWSPTFGGVAQRDLPGGGKETSYTAGPLSTREVRSKEGKVISSELDASLGLGGINVKQNELGVQTRQGRGAFAQEDLVKNEDVLARAREQLGPTLAKESVENKDLSREATRPAAGSQPIIANNVSNSSKTVVTPPRPTPRNTELDVSPLKDYQRRATVF